MKANEFVKKYWWDFAIQLSEMNPHRWESSNGDELSTSDLKPYVDAYELVWKFGGLNGAKKYHYDEFRSDKSYNELQQPITLVEEIGECND